MPESDIKLNVRAGETAAAKAEVLSLRDSLTEMGTAAAAANEAMAREGGANVSALQRMEAAATSAGQATAEAGAMAAGHLDQAGQAADRAGQAVEKMSQRTRSSSSAATTVLGRVRTAVAAIGEAAGKAGGKLTLALSVAAGNWLAALPGKIMSTAKSIVDAADATAKAITRSGMGARAFQTLAFAASLAGASMAEVGVGIRQLQVQLTEGSKRLEILGLDLDELRSKSPERQFMAVADAIAAIEDPARRTAAAVAAFGESGTQLLPMIANLREAQADAERLRVILDEGTLKAAEEFNDRLTRMGAELRAEGARTLAWFENNKDKIALIFDPVGPLRERALDRIWQSRRERLAAQMAVIERERAMAERQQGAVERGRGQRQAAAEAEAYNEALRQQATLLERIGQADQAAVLRQAAAMGKPALAKLGGGDEQAGLRILAYDAQVAGEREQRERQLWTRLAAVQMDDHELRLHLLNEELVHFEGSARERVLLEQVVAGERARIEQAAAEEIEHRRTQLSDRVKAATLSEFDYRMYLLDEELARFRGTAEEKLLLEQAIAIERGALEERQAREEAQVREHYANRIAAATLSDVEYRMRLLDEELARFRGTEEAKQLLMQATAAERRRLVEDERVRELQQRAAALPQLERDEKEQREKALRPLGEQLRERREERRAEREEMRQRERLEAMADRAQEKQERNEAAAAAGRRVWSWQQLSVRDEAALEWRQTDRERMAAAAAGDELQQIETEQLQQLKAIRQALEKQLIPARLG